MSIRHPELVDLVERVHTGGPLTPDDRGLLEACAAPPYGVEDQLDGGTVEAVRELTGRENVWSPERAARALLKTIA